MYYLVRDLHHIPYRGFFIALSLLLCSCPLAAAPVPLSHYYQDYLTTRDGLPQNSINGIAQTSEGYLWFATWEGLARYNGNEFRVFTRGEETGFSGSAFPTLRVDGEGLLAVETRGGLSYYQDQVWTAQHHLNVLVNDIFRDKEGLLWVATQGEGLYVYQDKLVVAHFN